MGTKTSESFDIWLREVEAQFGGLEHYPHVETARLRRKWEAEQLAEHEAMLADFEDLSAQEIY